MAERLQTSGRASPTTMALSESRNIRQQATEQVGSCTYATTGSGRAHTGKSSDRKNSGEMFASPTTYKAETTPVRDRSSKAKSTAEEPPPALKEGKHLHQHSPQQQQEQRPGVEVEQCSRVVGSPAVASDKLESTTVAVDSEAESLALARQLLEEEAMASYAAAVGIFRDGAGAEGEGAGAMEGIAPEDMAVMRALMEEDENNPDAYAMAEDDSLDYDGMLELGSAIGDVRKERWRLRCDAVIKALPRFSYASSGSGPSGDDTKCLVCQCDFEAGEELRGLPCTHAFHTECVDGWLEDNEECPTCRHSIDVKKPKS